MGIIKSKTHLIKIQGSVAYMPINKYIQEADYNSLTDRYYIRRGCAGGLSISGKRCIKLASGVILT